MDSCYSLNYKKNCAKTCNDGTLMSILDAVVPLEAMGFAKDASVKALMENEGNLEKAMASLSKDQFSEGTDAGRRRRR